MTIVYAVVRTVVKERQCGASNHQLPVCKCDEYEYSSEIVGVCGSLRAAQARVESDCWRLFDEPVDDWETDCSLRDNDILESVGYAYEDKQANCCGGHTTKAWWRVQAFEVGGVQVTVPEEVSG